MVHQTYVNRLVLGRSAFEPPEEQFPAQDRSDSEEYVQQYDSRGYPENTASRQLARQSRRSQNDILTTIGVCVCVNDQTDPKTNPGALVGSSKADQEQVRINLEEHGSSFWIEFGQGLAFSLFTEWIDHIRRRVQTFDYYLGVPLWAVIRSEYRHLDPWTFFLAGKVPFMIFRVSADFLDLALDIGSRFMPERFQYTNLPKSRHIILQRTTFILLSPLYILCKLRQLGLLLDWGEPALSSVLALVQPGHAKRTFNPVNAVRALVASPLPLALLYLTITERLEPKLYTYCKALFTRPDNPSLQSYRLPVKDDEFEASEAPVFSIPTIQPTLHEEFARDYSHFSSTMASIGDFFSGLLAWRLEPTSESQSKRRNSEPNNQVVTFANETFHEEPLEMDEAPGQTSTPPGSPPQSPRSSVSDSLSDLNPSAVQVRTRSGSTSTLHMDLEVHLPLTAQQIRGERRRNSTESTMPETGHSDGDSARPRNNVHHRVTALTILPAHELAGQVAIMCTAVLLVPLESIVMRRIAGGFLDSKSPPPIWLRDSVYQPIGLGLSKYGWKGLASYSAHIALCFGIQSTIGLGVWRLGSGVVMWFGRRKFGWGKL